MRIIPKGKTSLRSKLLSLQTMQKFLGKYRMVTETAAQTSDYERREAKFAQVRAYLSKLIHAQPGLTNSELKQEFLLTYGFIPETQNRLRELERKLGWIVSRKEDDGLLHYYPKEP